MSKYKAWFDSVPRNQRHLVDQALKLSRDGGFEEPSESIFQRLQAEEQAKSFTIPDGGTLKDRGQAVAAALARTVDVLAREAEAEHAKYASGDEPFDRAAWEQRFAQDALENPDGAAGQIESIAPGLVAAVQSAKADLAGHRNDLTAELDARTAPYFRGMPLTSTLSATAQRAVTESTLAGDDVATAERRLLRQLVEADQADALLDAAGDDPKLEQRLFDAAANGPTEPVVDPFEHLSDAQIEAALAAEAGGTNELPSDRPMPSGVSVHGAFTSSAARERDGYSLLEREVSAMKQSDEGAAGNSAGRDYKQLFER